MAWRVEAKGHIAKVQLFDDETVFIPLRLSEVERIASCWLSRINTLEASGDYPEQFEDELTYRNIMAAHYLLTQENK